MAARLDGYQCKLAITRERQRFSKIHESNRDIFTWRSCSCLRCGVEVNTVPGDRMNEWMKSIFVTLGGFIAFHWYASCYWGKLISWCLKKRNIFAEPTHCINLYKQLGVTVNSINYASTLQDGGVGFDTMLIGFSLDLSALPKLSCSTDRTYKCLGSQLWVFLSSEESKKAITVSQP